MILWIFLLSCGYAATQSQLNLERSKSRMGTFVEGGPMAETNPDEGYEIETNTVCLLQIMFICSCRLVVYIQQVLQQVEPQSFPTDIFIMV